MKKVKVLERFVSKGRIVRYPGEVINVSNEQAGTLIQRGIAESLDEETPGWTRKPCEGCPKRR